MNPLASFGASSFINAAKNATNSLLNSFDNGTRGYYSYDAAGNKYNTSAGYQASAKYNPAPKVTPASTGGGRSSDSWAAEMAASDARYRALEAQMAAQPKLANFDILANYNKAKQTATEAVTPLYNKKLNLFLEGQGIKKDTKNKETNLARENNQISLTNALGDNATNRSRTGEDLASALQMIGQNADYFQQDEGQQFDQERRAAQEELAAAGGTDTGLGQQGIAQMTSDRNTSSQRQVQEFENQKASKQLLATRTIDDLATSDTRATQKKGQDDKAIQIDFDSYMSSLANEEESFKLTNDLEKALQISQQTQSYQNQGVQEFIAGLAGQGYRAQDIALAKQVYG